MKRILCYGDSNTWGYNPITKVRYDDTTRWTRVLARTLGSDYEIIEEGLNGRTTVWDDPVKGQLRSGLTYLTPCLESHCPLDLVVLMLGTNDLKMRFSLPASDIAEGAGVLVNVIHQSTAGRNGKAPQVLLLAPPPVAKMSDYREMFEGSEIKSQKLGERYRTVAELTGCAFLDTSTVISSSDIDGIHFDPAGHAKLGKAIAPLVRKLLG